MKITKNVIKLDCTKGSYAYAVIGDEGVTLIDTSLPGRGEKILSELKTYGINLLDIKKILLTHHDIVHIGNAAYFQENCDCKIFISSIDYDYALGHKKRHGIKKVLGAIMKVDIPKSLKQINTDKIACFSVISTPGHTPGHTCFQYNDVMFVGDLISSKNGNPTMPPSIMNWNKEKLIDSLQKLSVQGVRYLCPAHGEPIEVNNNWSDFINKISRRG